MPTARQPVTHIPSEHPVITREMAEAAAAKLHAAAAGSVDPKQARAAADLLRLYQTQDRYTPERVRELAQRPQASQNIRELHSLTPEKLQDTLNEITESFTADYPKKPA